MIASPRDRYLTEMQELACRFEELAEALRPVAGEKDVIVVPLSIMRRLMQFCEDKLARLQKVAEYADCLPDEAFVEILAAGDRRGEGSDVGALCQTSDEEWFLP